MPDADLRILPSFESLARSPLAGVRRRPPRVHAANDQHACQTLERVPARGRIWPPLSGAVQMFSRGDRGLLLPGCPLCRAQRVACELGVVRGGMAMVEPTTRGARGSGVPNPIRVAAAEAGQLAGNREPPADRGGVGGPASVRPAWLAIWKCRLDCKDREAIENRTVVACSRKTKERIVRRQDVTRLPKLPAYPGFGGCDLLFPSSFWVRLSLIANQISNHYNMTGLSWHGYNTGIPMLVFLGGFQDV